MATSKGQLYSFTVGQGPPGARWEGLAGCHSVMKVPPLAPSPALKMSLLCHTGGGHEELQRQDWETQSGINLLLSLSAVSAPHLLPTSTEQSTWQHSSGK